MLVLTIRESEEIRIIMYKIILVIYKNISLNMWRKYPKYIYYHTPTAITGGGHTLYAWI